MTDPATRARRADRGSVLMLFPAAVLVVVVLGAIAVDGAAVWLRQRQASALASDLANDLATAALDIEHFRAAGELRIDPAVARGLAARWVRAGDLGDDLVAVSVAVPDPLTVTVTVRARATYVFAPALPGSPRSTTVSASVSAAAVAAPAAT